MVLCKQVVFFGVVLSLSTCHIDGKIIPQAEQNLVKMEGCVVNGVKHNVGDSWEGPVGECTTHTCVEDGIWSGKTCAEFMVTPESGCHKTEYDLTVQYPNCCPRAVCPEVPPTSQTLTVADLVPPSDAKN